MAADKRSNKIGPNGEFIEFPMPGAIATKVMSNDGNRNLPTVNVSNFPLDNGR